MSIFYTPPPKYDAATLAQMQQLWEEVPELSAKDIAAMFGVSKSTVIGQAHRREWKPRRGPPEKRATIFTRPTIFTRLAALDVFPSAGSCVFPIGDPGKDGFRFCGAPATEVGAPYCPEHGAKCRTTSQSENLRARWEADPGRHEKQAAMARRLGLADKMRAARRRAG